MRNDTIRDLLGTAPIIDGHNDLPYELRVRVGYDLDAIDLTQDQAAVGLHTDLPRLRAGGVGAQFWSVYASFRLAGGAAVTAALEQIDCVHRVTQRHPEHLALATTADEVEAARERGQIASLIGVEGGHCIDSSLGTLRMLHALGARYLTLTHNRNTPWADSATDTPMVDGLSAFGREVVRECNRLGVMADLAHVAPRTMRATLDTSSAPGFVSHSGARALCDSPRNVPDDVLVRIADSGGIVMVAFVPGFLTEPARQWFAECLRLEAAVWSVEHAPESADYRAARNQWRAANPCPPTSVADVADHVEHVRAVAGLSHVGIGSDFDGTEVTPAELSGVHTYPRLLAELAERGWSEAELAQLTWHNALRVLRDTEAAARAAQAARPASTATLADLDGTPAAL
jgi:membrane dipeptidase